MFDYKSNQNIFNMFAISLLFITLNNVFNPLIGDIGFFSILLILVISSQIFLFVFMKKNSFNKVKKKFFIIYFVLILVFSLGTLMNLTTRGFITLGELILVINFFLLYSMLNYEKPYLNYNFIFLCLTIYLFVYCYGIFRYSINSNNYSSIYRNPNILGYISLLFSGISLVTFSLSRKKIYFVYAILFSFFVYLSGSRSSMIAGLMIIFLYIIYKYLSKNKFTWNLILVIILVSIFTIIYVYPNIMNFSWYAKFANTVYKITGKSLLSGRQIIWKQSMNLIAQKPLFGYGTGTQLSNISNIQLSAHNLYIQILLQNGIIGLLVFIFLIISIWNLLYINKDDKVVRFCSCFFIGILYQNVFEVTFLQNNMSAAIMQWFIIAVGVSKSLNKRHAVEEKSDITKE
jgi:O-antigen ligase